MNRLLALALFVAIAAPLASCADEPAPAPAPGSGCKRDLDCPTGTFCGTDGLCREEGRGAGEGGEDACGASDDCWLREISTVPDVYWDGGVGGDPVCTVPQRSCPGAASCPVPTECLQPPPGSDRPGAFACERDDQCLSGRCLPLGSTGICAKACANDQDCPFVIRTDGSTAGFSCGAVNDAGVPVKACLPTDPALPEATLCASDWDCVAADGCDPAAPGPLACRFEGNLTGRVRAVALCTPRPEGGGLPTLTLCPADPTACAGGACNFACDANAMGLNHFCRLAPERCVQPCDRDLDCPDRTVCMTGQDDQRVGSWLTSYQERAYAGRELRLCLPPSLGCYDEVDCCPEPDGNGGCAMGWTVNRGRCSVELGPPAATPRLVTVCKAPDGRATPGECCATHGDCDSALCVPARPGGPCAGDGVCSVPCDPSPDPDGLPGSGDERDRCALGNFPGEYHLASSCLPFDYEVRGPDGSSRLQQLNVCR